MDFFATAADVENAFKDFASTINPQGFLTYCADDPGAFALAGHMRNLALISYGVAESADLRVDHIELGASGSQARAVWHGKAIGFIELMVPGHHNLLNAAAALATGIELGFAPADLLTGLATFRGTGRRFELVGTVHGIRVVDDYGHHPTEIQVTLAAARRFAGDGRLLVIFQPHRYSRTQAFAEGFAKTLDAADQVIVLEIYAASEKPIQGVTSQLITDAMTKGRYIPNFIEVTDQIINSAQPGDVIITLGAGDVSSLAPIIIDGLSRRFE